MEAVEARRKACFEKFRRGLPGFSGDPPPDFERAENALRAAAEAEKDLKTAERHLRILSEGVDMQAAYEYDEADLAAAENRMETERHLRETEDSLREIRSQWDQQQGRIESLGDPASLGAERESLLDQMEEARQRNDALELALLALSAAQRPDAGALRPGDQPPRRRDFQGYDRRAL